MRQRYKEAVGLILNNNEIKENLLKCFPFSVSRVQHSLEFHLILDTCMRALQVGTVSAVLVVRSIKVYDVYGWREKQAVSKSQ